MSAKFYTLLTDIGAAKLASAAALGVPLKITQMAVGDGGGALPTPSAQQTKLVAEKRRADLNMLYIDPQNSSQIIAEQVIPETEGGWWIREVGLFDETGALIAVGNCPESYKPQLAEGSGRTQTVRMVLITSSTDNITLKIDPAVVLATRKYVDDKVLELKVYVDDLMAKHIEATDPHPRYAPKASPTFTGTPTAPTPASGDNSKKLATTEFVVKSVASLDEKNQAKYLPKAGGDITGRLGVAGKLEVGKSETESVIALGSSNILRDNGKKALVISSESGAGSTAGIYLRPIGSTDSSIELHGSSSGWNFTGTPTATTPAATDKSSKLATTQFVARAIANLAGSAPETLDTLKELADALGNDPNFATTVLNKLTEKLAKDQNGADIPEPTAFIKNLGLRGAITGTESMFRLPAFINGQPGEYVIQTQQLTSNTSSGLIVFPEAFNNKCMIIIAVDYASAAVDNSRVRFNVPTKSQCEWFGQTMSVNPTPVSPSTWAWLAIGY
ncbi:phage tail protein [Klebsiella aerogenes]